MEEHQKDWGALVTAAQSGDERAFETLIKEIEIGRASCRERV